MKAGKQQQLVERYIDAVSDNDQERIQSFFCEETVFENLSEHALVGRQAIWQAMASLHDKAEAVDWQVEQLAETDTDTVSTQGQLRYLLDGEWLHFDVTGSFKIRGSKIVHWH